MRRMAVICDLDGTLTSCAWRRHFVESDPKDWASFNAGIPFDPVVPEILGNVRDAHKQGLVVLITTGRSASSRYACTSWLTKHEVPYHFMFMRASRDQRADDVVKEEIYLQRIEPFFDVIRIWDDRPMVCDMWRRLGLPLTQVIDPELPPSPLLFGESL